MKLLVDENLSIRVAGMLRDAGHDAVHVTAVGLGSTNDEMILQTAANDGSIIVTADADFGTLLALRGDHRPSVLMLRSSDHLTPSSKRNSSPWP
jgi:predicted nuclease of predicted toxin-antitoxin system